MNVAQFFLAVFGLTAMACALAEAPRLRALAPWVGLAGQPFWLLESWGRWGMFVVCLGYTGLYARSAWRGFVTARNARRVINSR